jgi:hypothetical protein
MDAETWDLYGTVQNQKCVTPDIIRGAWKETCQDAQLFEDDPPRHQHHIRERRLVEQHKRARSQSSDGTRDWNGGAYGAVDEGNDQEKSRSFHDEYGRSVPFDFARRIRSGFQQCLPDNPFRIYVEPYTSRSNKDFPDQLLLKFWTWWASLRPVRSTNQAADQTTDLSGLKNYDVADDVGDWCGLIMLDNWVVKEEKKGHQIDGSRRNFLLSLMQRRSRKRNVMSGRTPTYYVPKELENSEWDLYYVILIEHKIWSRCCIGEGSCLRLALTTLRRERGRERLSWVDNIKQRLTRVVNAFKKS